ncbi:HTH-type transcriptional regulator BhcR [Rhodovulum adriaticum]|uniref:IclR family transcriptional regulator n=1 Tax=Rhodovulum adriaticum TaxID=35804 RepID=A0A4R2NKX4_RHOAD|nr:HTH-type transcriptional regulator BhcR [Rhodovulum adriaticum]MBK1635139.1 IclR family transcriptional regulator [Rhodovulum adriaticum]TCP22253.1 IclR family transcriptional regulator [Rhodovulum adriaticum]
MTDSTAPAPPERRARGRPRAWTDTSEQNVIKALDRGIAVLERLGEIGGCTLSELAAALDQPAASIYRVLFTLETRGMVEFDADSQTWNIGAGAFRIGSRFLRRSSLAEQARPALRALMEATGETANLGVERHGQVLFLSQVETHAAIRAFFPPGTLSPMHSSGIGKALLAQMPPSRVEEIVKRHDLARFTQTTLTDPQALAADLAATRARGYAIDDEEKNAGMRCVAAPIFDMHGEAVAGVSVSGPAQRLPQAALPDLAQEVMRAARQITQGIGGNTGAGAG